MHSINSYFKTRICNWKKGADIGKIKKNIMKITDSDVNVNIKEIVQTKFKFSGWKYCTTISKTCAYRRAMKRAMQSVNRLNAKGIKMLSGRLAGNEIARTDGYVKEAYLTLKPYRLWICWSINYIWNYWSKSLDL